MDGFDGILRSFLEPFKGDRSLYAAGRDGPVYFLDALDRVEDFSLTGAEVLQSDTVTEHAPFLRSLLEGEDRIRKQGRILHFELRKARRFQPSGVPWTVSAKGPFSLAFDLSNGSFPDPKVRDRLAPALDALVRTTGRLKPEDILVAAVLPQKKKLLGVETPVRLEWLSLGFSLRFLMAVSYPAGPRLFAAGPMVREIAF